MIDYIYRFWYWITGFSIKVISLFVSLILLVGIGFFVVVDNGLERGGNVSGGEERSNSSNFNWKDNEFVIWHDGRDDQLADILKLSKSFTGVLKVKSVSFDSVSELEDSLASLKGDSKGPDLVIGDSSLKRFINEGVLTMLDEGKLGIALKRSDYSEKVLFSSTENFKFLGAPLNVDFPLFFYNKDLYGNEPPRSIDDLANWYLNNYEKYKGLCIEYPSWGGQSFVSSLGGAPWVDESGIAEKIGVGVGGDTFSNNFLRLVNVGDGKFVNGLISGECFKKFDEGEYAFLLTISPRIADFNDIKWGVAAFPSGSSVGSPFISSSLVFTGNSAYTGQRALIAGKFIEWLSSKDGQTDIAKSSYFIPARIDSLKALDGGLKVAESIINTGLVEREEILNDLEWFTFTEKLFAIAQSKFIEDREKSLSNLINDFSTRVAGYGKKSKAKG